MDLHMKGKVAAVTGASKGIGLAVTTALALEGANVAAGALHPGDGLAALAEHSPVHLVAVDLSTPDGPARFIDEATSTFGGLDILVNNVGAVRPRTAGLRRHLRRGVADPPDDQLSGRGAHHPCRVAAHARPWRGHRLLRAKAALANFCKALSKEVGPHGVRVNTVSPGPVSTGLWLGDRGVLVLLLASDRAGTVTGADFVIDGGLVSTL